jgi:hypothetical protein
MGEDAATYNVRRPAGDSGYTGGGGGGFTVEQLEAHALRMARDEGLEQQGNGVVGGGRGASSVLGGGC